MSMEAPGTDVRDFNLGGYEGIPEQDDEDEEEDME